MSVAGKHPLLPSLTLRSIAAFVAGALVPLSFAPFDWWPFGILGVAGLYFCLANTTPREAGKLGFWFGMGLFGVGASWIYVSIHDYGYAPPLLAGLITLVFVAFMASYNAMQCWAWRRYLGHRAPVWGFAASWVACEMFRSWFLTGFPWLFLGYAHVTSVFSGVAPIFGVFGLSYVVALVGALLASWLMGLRVSQPAVARHRNVIVIASITVAAFISTHIAWTQRADSAPLSVGLVQANIDQDLKFREDFLQESLNRYAELTAPLWQHDLVVWSETAIPMLYQNAGDLLRVLDERATANDSALITGIFFSEGGRTHNSITALGNGAGIWHKQKLVPFGEYVPFREWIGTVMQLFALPMSSMAPGPSGQEILSAKGLSIAPFICYEVVYPDFVRSYGKEADILLTISNDTWFGASFGPLQHLQMAAMRARELGRSMVRATNNGVSALIDANGEIVARTGQFRAETLEGEVSVFTGSTPFSRWGSWPVLVMVLGTIVFNLFARTADIQQQPS